MLKQVSENWSSRNLNFREVKNQIKADMDHKGISHYFLKHWFDFMAAVVKQEEKELREEADGRKINERLVSFFHEQLSLLIWFMGELNFCVFEKFLAAYEKNNLKSHEPQKRRRICCKQLQTKILT